MKKWIIKNEVAEWIAVIVMAFILFVVMGVLLYIGKYNVLHVGDDLLFVKNAINATNGEQRFSTALLYAFSENISLWRSWQGLYFADFIYLFLICFFNNGVVWIAPYVSLLPLVICGIVSGVIVLTKTYGMKLQNSLLLILPTIVFQLLFTPSPREGYYWLCSSIVHTLSFALCELCTALMIYMSKENGKLISKITIVFLCFAVGGGSYTAALPFLCIGTLIVIYSWIQKANNKLFLSVSMFWFFICFLINALSPGAKNRQSSAGMGYSAFKSVAYSFVESAKYIKNWTTLEVLFFLILMVPVCFMSYKTVKIRFRIHLVILLIVLMYGVFSAEFTPCLYALGDIGTYRVQNLYRFSLYIMLVASEWLVIGSIYCNIRIINVAINKAITKKGFCISYTLLNVVVILAFSLFLFKNGGRTMTFNSAYYSFRNGSFINYVNEYNERIDKLSNKEEKEVYLTRFSSAPYLLNCDDLGADENDFYNQILADFYDKEAVYTISE